jgi:hypothetical protein
MILSDLVPIPDLSGWDLCEECMSMWQAGSHQC